MTRIQGKHLPPTTYFLLFIYKPYSNIRLCIPVFYDVNLLIDGNTFVYFLFLPQKKLTNFSNYVNPFNCLGRIALILGAYLNCLRNTGKKIKQKNKHWKCLWLFYGLYPYVVYVVVLSRILK